MSAPAPTQDSTPSELDVFERDSRGEPLSPMAETEIDQFLAT